MPADEPNGNYDWRENIRKLNEAMHMNFEERDRIYRSIGDLRQSVLETDAAIANLVAAIRDLIDRIPPENLR